MPVFSTKGSALSRTFLYIIVEDHHHLVWILTIIQIVFVSLLRKWIDTACGSCFKLWSLWKSLLKRNDLSSAVTLSEYLIRKICSVLVQTTTAAVSLWVQWACCVQKILFLPGPLSSDLPSSSSSMVPEHWRQVYGTDVDDTRSSQLTLLYREGGGSWAQLWLRSYW